MRRQGTAGFLYQAGGLSAAPGERLAPALRSGPRTIARGYIGQHEDNEAVMRYLDHDARDLEWMVHRAGIGSDGPSKGDSTARPRISIGTFSTAPTTPCARCSTTPRSTPATRAATARRAPPDASPAEVR